MVKQYLPKDELVEKFEKTNRKKVSAIVSRVEENQHKIEMAKKAKATENELFYLGKILNGEIEADFDNGLIFYKDKLKPAICRCTGYCEIVITENHERHTVLAHRLMMMCAIKDIIPRGYEVDHLDNDMSNNKLSNLEIVTPSENARRRTERQKAAGFKFGVPKMTDDQLIRDLEAGLTPREIAIKYGYSSPVPVYHRMDKLGLTASFKKYEQMLSDSFFESLAKTVMTIRRNVRDREKRGYEAFKLMNTAAL